jgi:hypothetical protein
VGRIDQAREVKNEAQAMLLPGSFRMKSQTPKGQISKKSQETET